MTFLLALLLICEDEQRAFGAVLGVHSGFGAKLLDEGSVGEQTGAAKIENRAALFCLRRRSQHSGSSPGGFFAGCISLDDGDEFQFRPGTTWIEVVPEGATVSY